MPMDKCFVVICLVLLAVWTVPGHLQAGSWEFEFETGPVFSGYNDVRIPGDSGTEISLVDDLTTAGKIFFRGKLIHRFNRRHSLALLVAPLTLEADGSVNGPVTFEGVDFPAGDQLDATYRFDSYRLTYGYSIYPSPNLSATLGFTAKIRDAAVRLEGENLESEKTNTGFVPLLHLRLLWSPRERMSVLLDADALAAPQGRAEDVVFALQYDLTPAVAFRFGYRLLEGGADNDEVYNFTLLNYVVFGTVIRF
jgi:hypothetical protein